MQTLFSLANHFDSHEIDDHIASTKKTNECVCI